MKTETSGLSKANETLVRQVMTLSGRLNELEQAVVSQRRIIQVLSEKLQLNWHDLEVVETERVGSEQTRQDALSTDDYSTELRNEYGTTQWARRLIRELLDRRKRRSS